MKQALYIEIKWTKNVLLPLNKEQKYSNKTKITMITFFFYPLFDAQFVKKSETISFGP